MPTQSLLAPQWNKELVCHVNFPSHTTGSVANMLLLHRALGLRCVCRGWNPSCLILLRNREQSNHLTMASSSSSLCLEIEQRLSNKATSIIKAFSREQDHSHYSVSIQLTDVTLLYLKQTHKHITILCDLSYFPANLSFHVFQLESNNLIPLFLSSHSHFSPSPPSYLFPFFFKPSLSFLTWLPVSLHAHLLPTIDNIPDGGALLATHRQINQSNNTPINSNYALISPGRALLVMGKDVAVVEWLGVF